MATATDIAWAAGLFEGEGCFSITKPRGGRRFQYAHLILGMTDRDVVERFASIVDCGGVYRIRPTAKSATRKDQWRWEIGNKKDAIRVITMFLPYLGERRAAKAREVLAVASTPDGRTLRYKATP